MIRVREGTAADLPKVCDIKVRNWADTYRPLLEPEVLRPYLDRTTQLEELRRDYLQPDCLLLVAQEGSTDPGDEISGFALTFISVNPAPWLESLHVLRESRGHGAGTRLMQATAAELIGLGHNAMQLGVISGNLAAARFYERLGGVLLGVEPVSWAAGVTHMIYGWSDLRPLAEIRTSSSSG
ncbi:MAG TPA: GNAT family N-acetyltransferase [Candidatus Dormibacteraeota bacterium]|nr:GNAT family N-acetyltransferase [Candidatus Dormibacteraeota bacterium]